MSILTLGSDSNGPSVEVSNALVAHFHDVLAYVVLGIYAITVAVLVWGVLLGVARFVSTESKRLKGVPCEQERAELRKQVGFYLLFGLELLIAADVIETMISPTLEHLAILGGIALLRIVIGYALGKEIAELKNEAQPDT